MSELGQALAQGINERDSIRANQTSPSTIHNYFVFGRYRIKVSKSYFKSESRTVGTAFILGHSTNGVLGTSGAGGNDNVLGEATMGSWTEIETDNSSEPVTNLTTLEVAKWLNSESADNPTHIAIGTGSTAYDKSNDDMVSEVQTRIEGTMDYGTSKTVQIQGHFNDLSQSGITEVGIFTASSSGTLYYRKVVSSINMALTSQYRFTIKFVLSDASGGDSKVVDEGLNEIRDWMGGSSGTAPTYAEWNDSTTTPASNQTAADWDAGGSNEDRNIFNNQSRVDNIVIFKTTLPAADLGSVSITKSGTFNDSSNGNLFGQMKYGAIDKSTLFQVYEEDRYIITNT